MYITLVVPTITQYTKLHRMLTTVSESTRRPNWIAVIDNGKIYNQSEIDFSAFRDLQDEWCILDKNLGVAGSCNYAMQLSVDNGGWWLHANDDIEISPTIIADLENAALASPNELVFCPQNNGGSAFTFFLMNAQKAIDEIGWWDAEFFPAYFEDNDYAYRMGLKGYKWVPVPGGSYIHHTSSTLRSYTPEQMEEHHRRFRANQQYYIDKWGGLPGDEKFTIPFNGESHV